MAEGLFRDYRINGKRTLADVQTRWKLHLEPVFGAMKANEVTRETLSTYVDQRLREGATNASVNRELAALKRMFRLAHGDSVLRMPVFPHLQERNIRKGFVEDGQYAKLAAACWREGLWLRAMFETAYRVGWRVSESRNLRVSQVDPLNRTIRLEPGQTKNGEGRTAPIDDQLYAWLQACVMGKDSDRFVFSRDADGVRPIASFRERWQKVCCTVGLGKMVCPKCGVTLTGSACQCGWNGRRPKYVGLIFHDLRRSGVRNTVRDGISEKVAMTISGHKTRAIFDRYDIISESDLEVARAKMNARSRKTVTDTLTDNDPKMVQPHENVNTVRPH